MSQRPLKVSIELDNSLFEKVYKSEVGDVYLEMNQSNKDKLSELAEYKDYLDKYFNFYFLKEDFDEYLLKGNKLYFDAEFKTSYSDGKCDTTKSIYASCEVTIGKDNNSNQSRYIVHIIRRI